MLSRRQRLLLFSPMLLILLPFLIVPALLGFLASFTNYTPFVQHLRFVEFANYRRILQDDTFRMAVSNVFCFTLITVTAEMFIGVGVALALRRAIRGHLLLRFVLLLPWLISAVANGVMWHNLLNIDMGIPNYFTALLHLPPFPYLLADQRAFAVIIFADVWRKAPFVTFLVLPGLLALSPEIWDQARIDGLSTLRQVRHVVIPHLRVLLLTIMLLLVGDALGSSEGIMLLTGGGPGTLTMMPGLYSYQQAITAQNWVIGATSGWLITAAVLLVGICYIFLAHGETQQ